MKAIWNKFKGRRGGASLLLFVLGIGLVSSLSLAYPKPANAQWVVSAPVVESLLGADQVKRSVTDALIEAGVLALVNSVNYFTSQVAYYAALAILSDCPGQKSCWDSKAWGQALSDAALGSVGEAIGTLNEELQLGKLGFNLCQPSLGASLRIQLGLLNEYKPPGPKCSWNQISSSYTALKDSLTSGEMLESMKPVFEPGQTPIGVSMGVLDGVWGIRGQETKERTLDKLTAAMAGGEFSHVINPHSGRILAPAEVTKTEFKTAYEAREKDPKNYSTSVAAGQIASRAALSVAVNAAQTFAMTIISRLWNKLVNGLLSTEELMEFQPDLIFNPDAILQPPGEQGVAEQQQRKIVSAVPTRDASTFDPLIEFTTCLGASSAPNNCVMDAQFANAVRVGDVNPLTVREAMEKKMLHAEWPLFSGSNKEKDLDVYCYSYGYCESNLKKLRGARILPIGWEIAASKSSATEPVSLGEVVAGFDNCNSEGLADNSHPWCHLINPDWVLKAPPAQCRAKVNGPTLESSETNARAEVCADVATCLRQDDLGACTGGWGYCMRERNAWRFNGDACPFYYNSCRSFTTRTGGSESFLLNTVDHGVCNADNVGCLNYSTSLNVATCTLGSACTKEKGCVCEVATPVVSCTIAKGAQVCTDSMGGACRQNFVCDKIAGCPCTVKAACRVLKDQKSCSTVKGDDANDGDDWLADPQRFFNKNVETCDAGSNGCTGLIPLGNDGSLNLLKNGSFEELEDGDGDGADDHPKYWTPFGTVPAASFGDLTIDAKYVSGGERAMYTRDGILSNVSGVCTLGSACASDSGCNCASGGYECKVIKGEKKCSYTDAVTQSDVPIRRKVTYSMSATFTPVTGQVFTRGAITLRLYDAYGKVVSLAASDVVSRTSFVPDSYNEPAEATVLPDEQHCDVASGDISFNFRTRPNVGRITGSCTFVIDRDVAYAMVAVSGSGGQHVYVDDVQIEEGAPTPFHSDYNVNTTPTYAKVPPAYLQCTGDETERDECKSFAGICRENEVGCERYTPVNGDPAVPGITGPQDSCPAECAGYDIFKQEETEFETSKFPLYFIPSTAKECSEAESGCSEFTDVKTEKIQNYSRLRLCEKPSDDPKTVFYTWEGSDTTGYQLRLWNLKRTDDDAINRVKPDGTVAGPGDDPALMSDVSLTIADAKAGPAPCTKLDVATATNCTSIDSNTPAGDKTGLCRKADIDAGDFDCREFYDADGNRHYRLASKTILLTDSCAQYRITSSTLADCQKSNGRWDADKAQCIYNADVTESQSCDAVSKGCRPYKGNAATNTRTILFDGFEDGLADWSGVAAPSTPSVSVESVVVGGHSLKLNGSDLSSKEVGGTVAAGRAYTLSFWARGSGELETGFVDGSAVTCTLDVACDLDAGCSCVTKTGLSCPTPVAKGATTCNIPAIATASPPAPLSKFFTDASGATDAPKLTLATDWRHYQYGPVIIKDSLWGTASTLLQFKKSGTGDAYVDNITLKEVPDNIYVIKDSWVTPAVCDQTPQGVPSPQEMLGCKEYTTSKGTTTYLRSFTSLCRDRAVGCAAYSMTQNTPQNPHAETFNAVCQLKGAGTDTVLGTSDDTVRECGRCSRPDGGSGACNNGYGSCTIPAGSKYCNIPADQGSSCVCNYDTKNPVATVAGKAVLLSDVCRVAMGESSCRFKYEGPDKGEPQGDFPDRVIVPSDQRAYLVVKDVNRCDASVASCRNVGSPETVYEASCSNLDSDGVPKTCIADGGCSCQIFNSTCTIPKGESVCIASLEQGVIGKWRGLTLKDNPAAYEKTLCTAPAVGCEQFSAADGIFYFKEPANRVCTYKEGVSINNQTRYGWFRKSPSGTDIPCYPELIAQGDYYAMYKNGDATCTLDGGAACTKSEGCPCTIPPALTPACRVAKGNTTCGYQKWAGVCEAQYDRCEEFVDPADTSVLNEKGRPYYYIANNKLDLKSCSGEASLERGCVMFKKTSDTRSTYSTAATYLKSDSQANGGSVTPLDCNGTTRSPLCEKRCVGLRNGICNITKIPGCYKDADCSNKYCSLSKKVCVNPGDCGASDGTCVTDAAAKKCIGDQFLGAGCTDSNADGDDVDSGESHVCQVTDKCSGGDAYPYSFTQNDANMIIKVRKDRECAEWLTCTTQSTQWDSANGKWKNVCGGFLGCSQNRQVGESSECSVYTSTPVQVLTEQSYSLRDVTYKGLEYSGYSIPNRYPIQYIQLAKSGSGMTGKLYGVPPGEVPTSCKKTSDCTALGLDATCYSGYCFQDFTGQKLANAKTNQSWCRGYPESDSPFGSTVVEGNSYNADGTAQGVKAGFRGANICIQSNDCECHYQRNEYGKGSVIRFNGLFGSSPNNYQKVCVGGPTPGIACTKSEDCGKDEGGTCTGKSEVAQAVGWEGFCVDPDFSYNINGDQNQYACNLWLPVEQLAGAPDINNQAQEAGYVSAEDLLYCKVAQGNKRGGTYDFLLVDEWAKPAQGYQCDDKGDSSDNHTWYESDFFCTEDGEKFNQYNAYSKFSSTPVNKNQLAGIWVDGRAGCNDNDSWGDMTPFNFYLTEQNGWKMGTHWSEDDERPPGGMYLDPQFEDCYTHSQDDMGENCMAMKANFDSSGTLTGFNSVLAHDDNNTCEPSFPVKIHLLMREQCLEVAYMHNNQKGGQPSIPWTDKVINGYTSAGFDKPHASARFSTDQKPYGVMKNYATVGNTIQFNSKTPLIWNYLVPIWETDGGSKYTFVQRDPNNSNAYQVDAGDTVSGVPFSCMGDCGGTGAYSTPSGWKNKGANAWQTGEANLKQLFVVGWQTYKWNQSGDPNKYGTVGGDPSWDHRADYMDFNTATHVVAVDTGNCKSTGVCPEGPPGMTINGHISGDIVQGGGKLPVKIQYYAWANSEHMPIRKKTIDFGDGGAPISAGDPSYFRNRRGCKSTGTKCQSDAQGNVKSFCDNTVWGTTPQSCDQSYFEDSKTYICNSSMVSLLATASKLCGNPGVGYPCTRGGACVYQPRVRIVDNWGQCNGKCPGAPGSGDVCMNDILTAQGLLFDEDVKNINGTDRYNECSGGFDPASGKQAWTAYDGEIVVYPAN